MIQVVARNEKIAEFWWLFKLHGAAVDVGNGICDRRDPCLRPCSAEAATRRRCRLESQAYVINLFQKYFKINRKSTAPHSLSDSGDKKRKVFYI